MSDTKVKMIQVVNRELYVLGKLIGRHPEFPWLFSVTDVYKACEKPLKKEALKYGKDPEAVFTAKRPGEWMKRNVTDSRIDSAASKIRRRITKYGIDCGFRKTLDESNATAVALLSSKELCIKTVKGNTKLRGTYVAQDFIVLYAGFLNDKLQSSVIDTFISVLNGYTDEITKKVEKNERIAKGTQTRKTNVELNSRLVEACGLKYVIPICVQRGINEGVFGMSATKLKKVRGIGEPFNDNLTENEVDIKNAAIALATYAVRNHEKSKLSQVEGKQIGTHYGKYARDAVTPTT